MSDAELGNDFGFTFEVDAESQRKILDDSLSTLAEQHEKLKKEYTALKSNHRQMYNNFMALLLNLSKNPEKPMINWPNRGQKIQEMITQLNALKDVNV